MSGQELSVLGSIVGLARDIANLASYAQVNEKQTQRLAQRAMGVVNLLEPLRQRLSAQPGYGGAELLRSLEGLERALADCQEGLQPYASSRNWARAAAQEAAAPQRFEKLNAGIQTAAEKLKLGENAQALFVRADDAADLNADVSSLTSRRDEVVRLAAAHEARGGDPGAAQAEVARQFDAALAASRGHAPKTEKLLKDTMQALVDDFIVPWSELKLVKKLGGGAFGEVHLAKWRGIDDVAVKILKSSTTFSMKRELGGSSAGGGLTGFAPGSKEEQKAIEEFMNELKLMAKLRHPNIVQLMAVVLEPNRKALVMEYMPAGSLFDVIAKKQLSWHQIISIANDIAKGCAYLIRMGVLHRDLKSGNVMVRDDLSAAKICDFGLSQNLRAQARDVVGSIRWIAPELFSLKPNTERSDVFAFGMILYELVSRRLPFHDLNDEQVEKSYRSGQRPPIPQGVPPGFASIIEHCWQQDPMKRPTFAQMLEENWFAPPQKDSSSAAKSPRTDARNMSLPANVPPRGDMAALQKDFAQMGLYHAGGTQSYPPPDPYGRRPVSTYEQYPGQGFAGNRASVAANQLRIPKRVESRVISLTPAVPAGQAAYAAQQPAYATRSMPPHHPGMPRAAPAAQPGHPNPYGYPQQQQHWR